MTKPMKLKRKIDKRVLFLAGCSIRAIVFVSKWFTMNSHCAEQNSFTSILFFSVYTLIAPNEYRVFAGAAVLTNDTSSDRYRTVRSFTAHPDYNPENPHVNDIGVIIVSLGRFFS